MGITCFATDFRTYHSVSGICFLLNQLAVNRLGETGPSATGIELIGRDEQRLTRSIGEGGVGDAGALGA